MAVVGIWIAIVGYGIAYAGWAKIGGGSCSIIDAFQGKCSGPVRTTSAQPNGQTQQTRTLAQQQQQSNLIGTQPIAQAA